MMRRARASLFFAVWLCGCAKAPVVEPPPPPVTVAIVMQAGANMNPDVEDRASPLVVRVYELSDANAFAGADFFALWNQEAQTLAGTSVKRHEFILAPGAQAVDTLKLEPSVQQIGVAAAFRDIRSANWRVIVPVSQDPKGPRSFQLQVSAVGKTVAARLETKEASAGAAKK